MSCERIFVRPCGGLLRQNDLHREYDLLYWPDEILFYVFLEEKKEATLILFVKKNILTGVASQDALDNKSWDNVVEFFCHAPQRNARHPLVKPDNHQFVTPIYTSLLRPKENPVFSMKKRDISAISSVLDVIM